MSDLAEYVVPCVICGEEEESFLEDALSAVDAGARWLHIYEPAGESAGAPQKVRALRALLKEVGVPVWYEGGVRSFHLVEMLLGLGFAGVVMGSEVLRFKERAAYAWRSFGCRIRFGVVYPGERIFGAGDSEWCYHVWLGEALGGVEELAVIPPSSVLDFTRLPSLSPGRLCNLLAGISVEWKGIVVPRSLYPLEGLSRMGVAR